MWFLTPIQYAQENQSVWLGYLKDKSIWRGCRLGCTDMNTSIDLGTCKIWWYKFFL